jgi:hypothetical protein
MTILGWQLNTWSDAAFQFVLGYQIVNFRMLVVPFKLREHCFFGVFFFVVANSGYFTVFTPLIYFINLISMIAGNLVEIRLPKIQSRKCLRKYNLWRYSRKCLRKFNFNEIRLPELSAYYLPQPKAFFPSTMFEIFSSILVYRIFVLLLVVVFFHYVIYCCQYHEPLCNIKKTNWSMTLAIFMFELLH